METILDLNELDTTINKIQFSVTEEKETFVDLDAILKDVSFLYKTDNDKLITDLQNQILIKTKKIQQVHDNYLSILTTVMARYEEAYKKSENILRNI